MAPPQDYTLDEYQDANAIDDEDQKVIVVDESLQPLTPERKQALEEMVEAIERITDKVNSLPDNAILTLPNGDKVSGLAIKQLWARTDFAINPRGTTYDGNQTTRGEVDHNHGDPVVSFNIDTVEGYASGDTAAIADGRMNYLLLHELGHVVGGPGYFTEQTANDFARALADHFGMDFVPTSGDSTYVPAPGFSTTSWTWEFPSGSGDAGTGGGTGSGGGGSGDAGSGGTGGSGVSDDKGYGGGYEPPL